MAHAHDRAGQTVPAQPAYPLLRGAGGALAIAGFVRDPLAKASRLHAQYGDLVGLHPGRSDSPRKPMFLAVGARLNQSVLSRADDFRPGGVLLRARQGTPVRRLRNGIFSRNDAEHRSLRRAYAKPQSARALAPLEPLLIDLVDREVANWPRSGQANLVGLVARITRLASARFLFGNMPEQQALALCTAIDRLMLLNNRLSTYVLQVPLPATSYRALQATAARVERMLRDLTEQRMATGQRGNDILSALLERGEGTERETMVADIVSQLPTVFAASQETCRASLIWTLILLAQHPPEYRALSDSLAGGETSLAALRENAVLTGVLRESMRLLPAIPFLWRYARRPTQLLPGLPVIGGTRVILSQYLTNRDPDLFPAPARFDPERWQSIEPTHFEFMDYSAGARRCIGLHYAEALLPIALSRIVGARSIRLVEGQRIDHTVAVTLRPKAAVHAEFALPGVAPKRRRIGGRLTSLIDGL